MRCLESSVTDFGNIFHFRKDRPTALNSNIQILNSKQSANPNFQNSKQKHSEGSVLVCYLDFLSLVFICYLEFVIWNFPLSGKSIKYGAFFPNVKLPFLGTELMRRGTRSWDCRLMYIDPASEIYSKTRNCAFLLSPPDL